MTRNLFVANFESLLNNYQTPKTDYDYNPFGSPPPPVAGGIPGAPAPGQCPAGFETFAGFCYYFGNHASYMAATVECQKVTFSVKRVLY